MKINIPYQHTMKRVLGTKSPARNTLRRKRIMRGSGIIAVTQQPIEYVYSLRNVLQEFSNSIERMLPSPNIFS